MMESQDTPLSAVEQSALRWCRKVHPIGIGRKGRVAELYDHLLCSVEERAATGVNEEQALQEAIAQLGGTGELAREHAKLHGLEKWSVVLAALATGSSRALDQQLGMVEEFFVHFALVFSLYPAVLLVLKLIPSMWFAIAAILVILAFYLVALKGLLMVERWQTYQVSEKTLRQRAD